MKTEDIIAKKKIVSKKFQKHFTVSCLLIKFVYQ